MYLLESIGIIMYLYIYWQQCVFAALQDQAQSPTLEQWGQALHEDSSIQKITIELDGWWLTTYLAKPHTMRAQKPRKIGDQVW
jgi:hypothetical protein